MSKPDHQRALDVLVYRAGQWSRVHLVDGRICLAYDVAGGYDFGDEVAHITTNISPGPNPDDELASSCAIDFFFADEIAQVFDHHSGALLFERNRGDSRGRTTRAAVQTFVRRLGGEASSGRHLYLIEASDADRVPTVMDISTPNFVCFLAWDADPSSESVANVAGRIIRAGCAYLCCWGANCSFVHDTFDEVATAKGGPARAIITTWHEAETLLDALWFAIFTAQPDETFARSCGSVVAISIGCRKFASQIRKAMTDPEAFKTTVLRAR
jgi:hypothetical protein